MIKLFTIFIILLSIISCGTSKKLTEQKAVKLAENYILKQGYTSDTTQIDSANIDYDFKAGIMSYDYMLKSRFNTLKPKAKFHGKRFGIWTVGFEHVTDSIRFRFVWISRNGKKIELPHQDLELEEEIKKSD